MSKRRRVEMGPSVQMSSLLAISQRSAALRVHPGQPIPTQLPVTRPQSWALAARRRVSTHATTRAALVSNEGLPLPLRLPLVALVRARIGWPPRHACMLLHVLEPRRSTEAPQAPRSPRARPLIAQPWRHIQRPQGVSLHLVLVLKRL